MIQKETINLLSSEGNAFYLIGSAKVLGTRYHIENADDIIKDMMSSDYNHLVEVFQKNFNEYVELVGELK